MKCETCGAEIVKGINGWWHIDYIKFRDLEDYHKATPSSSELKSNQPSSAICKQL